MYRVKLLDLVDISGSSVSNFNGERYYLSTGALNQNKIENLEKVTYLNKPSRANLNVDLGEIIFAKMKNTDKCLVIDEKNKDLIVSTGFYSLRPQKNVLSKFIYYFCRSNVFHSQKDKYSTGATMQGLTNPGLKKIYINQYNMETQQKIVEELDLLNEIIEKQKKQLKEYDNLVKSQFIEMFGEKSFTLSKLKNIARKIGSGSTPLGGNSAYKDKGIPLIRSMNVYDNYFKYNELAFLNDNQANKLNNVIVEKEDIIFNITGASICRACIVPIELTPARVNQHVSIIRADKNKINPCYLLHLLINPKYKAELYQESISSGATREALTKKQLENFEIPVPPLPLQNQFAEFVKHIDKLKFSVEEQLKETQNLLNSRTQKYFG